MDKKKYDSDENLNKNLEVNKFNKNICDILFEIDRNCLRPIIFFLKSIPSGFAPLPLHSLTAILEHNENENLKSAIYCEKVIQNEIRNLNNNIWFEFAVNYNTNSLDEKVTNINDIINKKQCINNNLFELSEINDTIKNNSLNSNINLSNFNDQFKLYKTVISLEQVLYIYKLGGINNENVWTALFGTEKKGEGCFNKFIMPSFLSNKILMESYSNIIRISEPQHNSLQIYMYCRNILKHFCNDIITPRILIHANIFLLWNSTLKDTFKNKTYDKILLDFNNEDNSYSLYTNLINGNLPSLLLLKVLEEEFAKFSVLVHFLIKIFGYLDRNNCHIFSNSPNLSITSLLYFYKCVFFPLSSSITAALLNIITIERDYFIQSSLRILFSSKMNDENIFICMEKDNLYDELDYNFDNLNQKCKIENHFSINIDNILDFGINISGKDYSSTLFNVINNIIYIMSNNSNNIVVLKRTNTLDLNSEFINFKNLNDQFDNKLSNFDSERKLTNWNRISRVVDSCYIDNNSVISSGLFWFTQEENDLTVYKTTIEDPFLKNTIYYYFNRLEYLFNSLDLKQCCILSNWILIQEEKRIIRIFPHRSHSNFLKLLENIIFYYLSKKMIESHKQSINNFILINKYNEYNRQINYNILFKGSIRSFINTDNYCALKSIYLLIMKDSSRSNSYNILKKILVRNDISSIYKKLEFPIKNLHLDISKLLNNTNNNNLSRQSSITYLLYTIYESIIEDINKAMKLEKENIINGQSKFYIQISDRFISIQILLSIFKRYLKFSKYSFLNDINIRKVIYRGIYDGLIIYFQDLISKNYYFLLFVLSIWINSFIDNRIIQLYNLTLRSKKESELFSSNLSDENNKDYIITPDKRSYINKFLEFLYKWSSIIFEKNSIKYEYVDILRTEMVSIVLNINSNKYSKNFELFINNIISSILLLKLFNNTEVIISHYKDRLCRRLLILNHVGGKLKKTEIKFLSSIMINICMEYYFLLNFETIKLIENDSISLNDELSLNEIFSLINNGINNNNNMHVNNGINNNIQNNVHVNDGINNNNSNNNNNNIQNNNNNIYDILNTDSTNVSLKSIKSLLDDCIISLFSNIFDDRLLDVFLTSSFNWKKIKKSSNLNKCYSQVNIPDRIKNEISYFESKYKISYPHRKINWLWDNGFVTLKAIGFKLIFKDYYEEIELNDFEIILSLSSAIILIAIEELQNEKININNLIKKTYLSKVDIIRTLVSLIIPGQNILKVSNNKIEGTRDDIINWRNWLNEETYFELSDITGNTNNFDYYDKFVLYLKILPKELFIDYEINTKSSVLTEDLFISKNISENYLRSFYFKSLFKANSQEIQRVEMNNLAFIDLPSYNSKIFNIKYPWNLDLYIDDNKYEEFFNSITNFIGSDEIFYSVKYEKRKDQNKNLDMNFYNSIDINNAVSCDIINSFVYKDNNDIYFEENYKFDGYKLALNKNYSLDCSINLFGNIIINNENSSRILLNILEIGNIFNINSFVDCRKFSSTEEIINSRLDTGNTEKKRCIDHFELDSSTLNDLKSKVSSSSSTFSLSSSSSSLIYMEPINNKLLNGYLTTIVEIICKIESLIIKLLKKFTSQTYLEIVNYIKNNWGPNINDIPNSSSINQALIKLIKRDFIIFICNHKDQECICESISQNIIASNDNTDVSNIFLDDSTFNYVP